MNNAVNHINGKQPRAFRSFARRMTWAAITAGIAMLTAGTVAGQTNPPAATQPAGMITTGTDTDGAIHVTAGKSVVVTTRTPFHRVNLAQPEIADVATISPNTLLLTAKKAGNTQLIVWDDQDKSQVIDVVVELDLAGLRRTINGAYPDLKVDVAALNEAISLRGRVPDMKTAEQIAEVAATYGKVHNFLEVAGAQQIGLQVRFAEMSRGASESLGFHMFFNDGSGFRFGAFNGPGITPIGSLGGNASGTLDSGVNLFASAKAGSTAMEFFLEAMRDNNLLRTLAEPNVVVVSGQEANFLAGGEFPIPVPQGGAGGGTTITIDYKEYGMKLRVLPEVLGGSKIRLKVSPEVSDLDYSNAVQIQGFVTPGLTKRTVTTTVELGDGQTFAIAGMLNNTVNANSSVTPILGDLPVLGVLFRSVRYQRRETELIALVTPHLVEPMNPGQVPELPGEHWREPTGADLVLHHDLGGPMPSAVKRTPPGPPPTYQGTYGFVPPATEAAAK